MNRECINETQIEVTSANMDDLRSLVDIEEVVSMQVYPNEELGITP